MSEACVPSLFDLRPNYGGGNEDNGDLLQKVTCMHCCSQCPWPCSKPPSTHASAEDFWKLTGKSGAVSCHCSFLLGPGTQKVLCALQESVSPVLCKFWQLYGGITGDLLQESLCHTQVCCTQSPCPCSRPLLTCTFAGDTETQLWLSLCGVSGSWCIQGLFEPPERLWRVRGLILNAISPLLPSCWGFSFARGCGISFLLGSNILQLTVVQQRVVVLEFLQNMSAHPSILLSYTTNLKEMGIPDHLIGLLRNLYAGQEATVRTGHGTTDWFQIGKGVRQSCISDSFTWAAIPSLELEQAWVPLLDWSVVKTAWHGALHWTLFKHLLSAVFWLGP